MSTSSKTSVRPGARRAGRRTLSLYLDASALVKRYAAEPGSDLVRTEMRPQRAGTSAASASSSTRHGSLLTSTCAASRPCTWPPHCSFPPMRPCLSPGTGVSTPRPSHISSASCEPLDLDAAVVISRTVAVSHYARAMTWLVTGGPDTSVRMWSAPRSPTVWMSSCGTITPPVIQAEYPRHRWW